MCFVYFFCVFCLLLWFRFGLYVLYVLCCGLCVLFYLCLVRWFYSFVSSFSVFCCFGGLSKLGDHMGAVVVDTISCNLVKSRYEYHTGMSCWYLENIGKYHFFRQLWLFLGVKLMEISSNLLSMNRL